MWFRLDPTAEPGKSPSPQWRTLPTTSRIDLIPIRELRLKRLTVVVPERHELVLMKTLRSYQHDVEVIEQIHRRQPLVFEVLRSR